MHPNLVLSHLKLLLLYNCFVHLWVTEDTDHLRLSGLYPISKNAIIFITFNDRHVTFLSFFLGVFHHGDYEVTSND